MTTITLPGTGSGVAVDTISSESHQLVKLEYGSAGAATQVDVTAPLPAYLAGQTVTGTLTGTGSVTISDLKGAATVTMEGVATAMTTNNCTMEVLTAAGVWETAKWIYTAGASGGLATPATAGSTSSAFASNSARAIADVAGYVGCRLRSVNFTGTSFAVTMVTSYAPTSRIGPDVDPLASATKAVNVTLLASSTIAGVSPTQNAAAGSQVGLAVGAIAAMPNTAEVASSARTTTGNSGTLTDSLGGAISATLNVTAASGTTPTLDLVLQESPDNGTTWVDVYHCERVTTTGVYTLPSVNLNGRRRWSWTIAGTTPSFTFSISSNRGGFAAFPRFVQFFDRTAGLLAGTLNAVSTTYQVAGCATVTAAITIGAATTGGTYKLRGSMDGANFYDLSSTVLAVASSTVQITSTPGITARFAQVLCSVGGSAQTGAVVGLTGTGY